MMKKINPAFLFVIAMVMLALLYSYPGILGMRPRGVHQWRQADCLSITTNFYEHGMHFFAPEIHTYISDDLTSGKTAGEFPATYYAVAAMWKVFGKHEWIYRLFTMLLYLAGIFYFFRTLRLITASDFWSIALGLTLFTAPVLVYYGSNFLSDIHAFSFVLIGGYHMLRYFMSGLQKYLFYGCIFLVFAGLLKITAFILFLTLGALLLLELVGVQLWPERKLFPKKIAALVLFAAGSIIVGLWYVYAEHYNALHGGKYTFNDIWPIWQESTERIRVILEKFRGVLVYQVFSKPWMYTLALVIVLLLMNFRKIPKAITLGLCILTVGCIAYVMLWFQAFDVHDYYMTNLYVLPAAITACGLFLFQQQWPHLLRSRQLKTVMSLLLLWNVIYASGNINMRYFANESKPYLASGSQEEVNLYKYMRWDYGQSTEPLETIEPYLESIGVGKNDLVITMPDESFNINLYLMNRRGWTSLSDESRTREGFIKRIERGAKYFIVIRGDYVKSTPFLPEFIQYPIGQYKNVVIYDLRPYVGAQ